MISRLRSSRFSVFAIIALLTAGLFYFWGYDRKSSPVAGLKPSQLNFAESNQLPHEKTTATSLPLPVKENSSTLNQPVPELSEKEKVAWATLDEILKTKNDNDPRMDRDLKILTPAFHSAIYSKYHLLKPEDRNERGTLVFLIARDLKSQADLDFLQSVYQEAPCTNMGDCSAPTANDPQDTGAQQTSLNYPQMAGLYQLDSQLSKRPELLKDPNFRAGIYALLKTAENFPAPQIHEKAQQIREKYGL